MFAVLADRTYRHLFLAQVVALLGTGLATVALGLLAYDISGARAGMVLGTIFTIKMVAYVVVAPVAAALAERLPRRRLLVALDLVRAGVALFLPFVTELWQAYLLVLLLQSASAAFTPCFQATIPDVLPEEGRYTHALSLSRLAYDLEAIASPIFAALLLLTLSYDALFIGTLAGFLASAGLVLTVRLPRPDVPSRRGIYDRTTRGLRIYLATPRLRGLLALNLAAAAAGAMVLVNTVVLVRGDLGLGETAVAVAMAAFGGGSMATALLLPRLLHRLADRPVMLIGAVLMCAALTVLAGGVAAMGPSWPFLLTVWAVAGAGYSAVLTPGGRLLRRSAHAGDRPAVFAAQFALSHGCWLATYPLAGWLMTQQGAVPALLALAGLAACSACLGMYLWPSDDPAERLHRHDDLPLDHPHLRGRRQHSHAYVIDDHHRAWAVP
ncbi:MFS transporter [Limimaricola pyoseonensis]|uniref:Predicted arabinose efflux permease, MFS family n=1 Tax=Limimaricola pyoseonensis TaxID=521013 RepID=A0A1G6ZZD9_9RHOB|nr:MFS transporter [Limimaricola pyoseonensis]SDE07851.1 Predicted arabinose efflux permease, MFS family [Limimaricola pyoseonensis]